MPLKRLFFTAAFTLAAAAVHAGPPATIDQLAWMSGTWSAPVGPNTLEENWTHPGNGSIAALVRMSGAEGIGMWELITIEEKDGSLMMSVQQWNKGFQPRTEVQRLELAEISAESVNFNAVSEGGMKSLGYSRSGDTFTIHLGQPDGTVRQLELTARK